MKNSERFRSMLDQYCELETLWASNKGPRYSGLAVEAGKAGTIHLASVSAKCPPYKVLKDRIDSALSGMSVHKAMRQDCNCATGGINALDELQESEFSVRCIIDGCAHALLFEGSRQKNQEIRDQVRLYYRDAHFLKKKKANAGVRAKKRAFAAFCLDPSIANAGRLLNLGQIADEQLPDDPVLMTLRKYGCALYPEDRLASSKHPSTAALLALNLDYVFRHWPVAEATFPTLYPKNQHRGCHPEPQQRCRPRRNIIAYFVNALFQKEKTNPDDETTYDAVQIKNLLNKLKTAKAEFCGW